MFFIFFAITQNAISICGFCKQINMFTREFCAGAFSNRPALAKQKLSKYDINDISKVQISVKMIKLNWITKEKLILMTQGCNAWHIYPIRYSRFCFVGIHSVLLGVHYTKIHSVLLGVHYTKSFLIWWDMGVRLNNSHFEMFQSFLWIFNDKCWCVTKWNKNIGPVIHNYCFDKECTT